MSEPAPAGSFCAWHPENAASWLCGRCGSFMCPACEQRVRPNALPMCPACWELRSRVASAQPKTKGSGTALQTTGLVLGLFALLPIPALQIASVITNIVGIAKAKEPPALNVRWRPMVGLSLTGVGLVISFLLFFG